MELPRARPELSAFAEEWDPAASDLRTGAKAWEVHEPAPPTGTELVEAAWKIDPTQPESLALATTLGR